MSRQVAITIDVEGDFGTSALRGVDEVLPWLLDGFAERQVQAIFFVLGETARQRPQAIRQLAERGHVVASHGLTHRRFSALDTQARRAELLESKALLEQTTGRACKGFRAPFFDLPHDLGPLLEETGYRWSSSKAPFSPVALYRHVGACWSEHDLAHSRVREIPVRGTLGLPLPEGLSYWRLFWPLPKLARTPPAVFYFHPYDLLEQVRDYDRWRVLKPLLTARQGGWSRTHLWEWIDGWRAQGATFEPPQIARV